jgi:gluconokinase
MIDSPPMVSQRTGGNLPKSIVVMGPSGCGKSTLAKELAEALGWNFVEGDDHHPPANREKMKAGEALTDTDRLPFLRSVGAKLIAVSPAVASCSALNHSHRDVLRDFVDDVLFVLPETSREELERRVGDREDHFMPPDLVQSQICALEPPAPDERFLALDGEMPTDEQVAAVLDHLAGFGG